MVQEALNGVKIEHLRIDGTTSLRGRDTILGRFHTEESVKVILVTTGLAFNR
jgi:SNF2 family DNA or RNA helicase